MTNKEFFKNVDKKKSKKTVDGYYYDGKNSFTLYKDNNGNMTKKKRGKK